MFLDHADQIVAAGFDGVDLVDTGLHQFGIYGLVKLAIGQSQFPLCIQ